MFIAKFFFELMFIAKLLACLTECGFCHSHTQRRRRQHKRQRTKSVHLPANRTHACMQWVAFRVSDEQTQRSGSESVVEGQGSPSAELVLQMTPRKLGNFKLLLFPHQPWHPVPIFFRLGIFSQQTCAIVLQCNKSLTLDC